MKKTVLLIIFCLILGACGENQPGEYDDLAKCLTERGMQMYGTSWCGHCQKQKAEFAESFDFINYTDCDLENLKCQEASVTGYPTWITSKGEILRGRQSLVTLAKKANCELPDLTEKSDSEK